MLELISGTGDALWQATAQMRMPGGVRLPLRMTVVRLGGGGLLLHSPIAIDDALAQEIEALGPVEHLVAPNCLHHLHITAAMKRFPQAMVHAAPGLAKKRPELASAREIGGAGWPGELEVAVLGGAPKLGEVILLHAPSRSLLCCDLVFNLRAWSGAGTGLFLWIAGTRGRLAVSRLFRLLVRDRAEARRSLRPVLEWPFERIIMAHGDIYAAADAPAALAGALAARLGDLGAAEASAPPAP